MPPRVARSNIAAAAPKTARNKNKKRALNAYASAQRLVPEKGPSKHRLGEDLDNGPPQKRRRDAEDEEDEDAELPERKRPAKRTVDDQGNDVEHGSDSEGNEWTMGALAEDDNDSDLDSDQAFGDSDDERFQGFTFRGSSGSKRKAKKETRVLTTRSRKGGVDLNEKEESEEDSGDSDDDEGLGFGDDAIDLAAMLDDEEEDAPQGNDTARHDVDEESASEEDEEEDSSDEDDEESDDNVGDEETAARLRDRLEALDSSSRHDTSTQPTASATLDDFLEDTGLAPEKTSSKNKKKVAKPAAITAPLPKRQQDRLDREIATSKAKAELEKWLPGTKQVRRAEHLSFPLQRPDDQGLTLGKEKFTPATQTAPQNELEESMQRIMEESGLSVKKDQAKTDGAGDSEAALLKAEDLAVKDLPVEEVMRRRAELRKARELLFREEIKAKRLAKIKSKSHRRVMRRQKEREKEALQAFGDEESDEDSKDIFDRKRAEARMSTKHRDSKWAKSLKQTNRTAWDEDARDGAMEQARRNEELKRRIEGKSVSDDEGSDLPSDDDDESDDEEAMLRKLNDLKPGNEDGKKGLANLKFMRRADERRRKVNDEDVDRLRRDLAMADGEEDDSDVDEEKIGRAIFGPQAKESTGQDRKQARLEFEAPEGSADDEEEQDEAVVFTEKAVPRGKTKLKLKDGSKKSQASGPLAQRVLNTDKAVANVNNGWLKAPKGISRRPEVTADVSLDLTIPATKATKAKSSRVPETAFEQSAGNTDGWTTVTYDRHSDSEAEDEPSDPIVTSKQEMQTLQQRAFAGDDVEAAFETEKADMVASEDEKEVSNHLPGWGSWTGDGLSKSFRKANERAKHNPLFKTKVDGVRQADRKDAKLKNVIISEKQDRKGKKYLAPVLPHEFETKEQYERSRRVPMGPEWTTKVVHQKMTKPRIMIKPGVNIRPLEKPIA